MMSVPIWLFVVLCIFAFLGFCILVMLVVMTVYAVVDAHYQVKNQEQKYNDCPYKVDKDNE